MVEPFAARKIKCITMILITIGKAFSSYKSFYGALNSFYEIVMKQLMCVIERYKSIFAPQNRKSRRDHNHKLP